MKVRKLNDNISVQKFISSFNEKAFLVLKNKKYLNIINAGVVSDTTLCEMFVHF